MQEVRFEVEGESVAGELHEPEGKALGNLVLVHGLLSQRAEFGDAGARLAAQGWRALAIDQRGLGASGGPRGRITQERATADVLAAFEHLAKRDPAAPEAVVGHSMGAVFALRALAERPSVRAGVLVAPMRTVRSELGALEFAGYRAAHALSRAKSALRMGSLVLPYKYRYRDLFIDEEAARRAEEAGFLHPWVDLANYPHLLAMDAEREARRVRQPVLVVVAEHDRAVKRESSMAVHDALAGEKRLVLVDSGHSVWTDRAADHVSREVDAFLRERLR